VIFPNNPKRKLTRNGKGIRRGTEKNGRGGQFAFDDSPSIFGLKKLREAAVQENNKEEL